MIPFALACAWGIVVLLAFIGWGALVNRVVLGQSAVDWGLRAAWGLAWAIAVGGVLNLAHAVSRTSVLLFIGAGVVFFAADLVPRRAAVAADARRLTAALRRDRLLGVGAAVLVALAALYYAGSVSGRDPRALTSTPPYFNPHDDFQAYLVFPVRMLETGHLGRDPFNDRRLVATLGGQAFLDTTILSALSKRNLHLMDGGIATLIVLGLLIGLCRRRRAPPLAAVVVCLVVLLVPLPTENISSVRTALALFIGLYRTLELSPGVLRGAALAGLVTAGLVASKNSLIPVAAVLVVAYHVLRMREARERGPALLELAVTGAVALALLLPWMIALHRSSGTLLYPIFGQGYDGARYGDFTHPTSELSLRESARLAWTALTALPVLVLLGLAASAMRLKPPAERYRGIDLAMAAAAVGGTAVLALALAGLKTSRYSYPFLMCAVAVLLVTLLAGVGRRGGDGRAVPPMIVAALAAGLLVGSSWEATKDAYDGLWRATRFGVRDRPLTTSGERAEYRSMQAAVPSGRPILTRLEKPFLLNFRRNPIYVVDYPGASSPPPGLPLREGSEAVAEYLARKSVRYLAYSYASRAAVPPETLASWLRTPHYSPIRAIGRSTLRFNEILSTLGRTRRHVYDDGRIFVLDLAARAR